jgi:hypothetical protein
MDPVVNWLLEKDQPAVRYRTLTEILDRPLDDTEVQRAFSQITKRGWAAEILREQLPDISGGGWSGYWHNYVLLNRPKYISTVWKFLVLTDLEVKSTNEKLLNTCRLLSRRYLKDKRDYHLCMTANIVRGFIRAGYDERDRDRRALDWLVDQQKEDGGWYCFDSQKGSLDCWEPLSVFAILPRRRWNREIKKSAERGVEFYLERKLYREGSKKYAPWFRFHYPVHYYYDLLVGLEVVASLGYAGDRRIRFAMDHLKNARRRDGRWNLDAVHPDIGSGKEAQYSSKVPFEPYPSLPFELEKAGRPSKMITLRALKVLKAVEQPKGS